MIRVKHKVPKKILIQIADAIFISKIRYGISVYLNPIYEKEELKMKKLTKEVNDLQVLQNNMIRAILGLKKSHHVNMQLEREKLKLMSVNQLTIYHVLLEAFNVTRNSASEQIKRKWTNVNEVSYSLRSAVGNSLKIPEKPMKKCLGFSYTGAKLFNMLPLSIKESVNPNTFKTMIKNWIWQNIPSY